MTSAAHVKKPAPPDFREPRKYVAVAPRVIPSESDMRQADSKLVAFVKKIMSEAVPVNHKILDKTLIEVKDLGIFTVPSGYDHATELTMSRKFANALFVRKDERIKDANFRNPTDILKPGDRIHVRILTHVQRKKAISNAKWIELLTMVKKFYPGTPIFPGAQGASLVLEHFSNKLPPSFDCVSVDHESRAWVDDDFIPRQTCISTALEGGLKDGMVQFGLVYVLRPAEGQAVISYQRID